MVIFMAVRITLLTRLRSLTNCVYNNTCLDGQFDHEVRLTIHAQPQGAKALHEVCSCACKHSKQASCQQDIVWVPI